ncbi:MAG: flagellar hook-associated protein FlgL [Armatimonadetes bacterium]|nr:flagellar hook-associated protein FlgL [Armatimonadota bacterium]MDW8026837.1 flagellar hook-associated protein FlgL [Armatimonadota bacterium]
MRITPMILARQAVQFINRNAEIINESLERIGTGKRINRAYEDPPGTVLSMRLQSDIIATEGDRQRLEQALPYIQAADASLQQAISVLQRARELILQAGNDTVTSDQRLAIANEMAGLRSELMQIANARIGDRFLFSGASILTKPFELDANGNAVYHGDSQQLTVKLSNGEEIAVTLDGSKIFQEGEDVFAVLKDAFDALVNDQSSSLRNNILPRLDRALDQIVRLSAIYGAQSNRIERTIDTINFQEMGLKTALSPVLDADIAQEFMTYQLKQTTMQATLFAVSRIVPMSLVDFMA